MKKKVLTVDDSRTIRNMLLVTLNNAGFDIVQAEDGIEGLEVLEESNPDVIVTDINMPRMNGHEFLAAVREDPALASSIVFVYSTSTAPEDRNEADSRNVAGYLLKRASEEALHDIGTLFDAYSRAVELPNAQ